ncbi:MAG: hypothetical protein HYY90_05425 [Candidatus Omnitrophica bacterium]|nr:hypothetical protein [Candidatus Omnitrophota bacterium]
MTMLGLLLGSSRMEAEAEITLKLMAVNPSQEQNQQTEVKAYLPKEVKADDILEISDLAVAYDAHAGAYYVYGEYELKPGESLEREVVIRDVWVIPPQELETLRLEAEKTTTLLERTDFKERANFLREVVEAKLTKIAQRQQGPEANPEKHISDYRDNLATLESVKADLMVARSLLAQAKPKTSPLAIWRLFLLVVLFLGLLGGSFYLVWMRQLKTITAPTFGTGPTPATEDPRIQQREAKGEKPLGPEDIEKIIHGG